MQADVTHWKNTEVGGSRQGCADGDGDSKEGDKNKSALLPFIPTFLVNLEEPPRRILASVPPLLRQHPQDRLRLGVMSFT